MLVYPCHSPFSVDTSRNQGPSRLYSIFCNCLKWFAPWLTCLEKHMSHRYCHLSEQHEPINTEVLDAFWQASTQCHWKAAHGPCAFCHPPRHHGAVSANERTTYLVASWHRSCRNCNPGTRVNLPVVSICRKGNDIVSHTACLNLAGR